MKNILGIIIVCIAVFFVFNSAYAVNTPDTIASWYATKNYAMLGIHPDCTNYGHDVDNDGICDNWENSGTGLHIDMTEAYAPGNATHYRYDLSCIVGNTIANDPTGYTVCPSSNKKDVYVELDWMTGQDVSPTAIADVVKAYDKMGIALHVQYGENPSTNSGDIGQHICDVNYPFSLTTNTGSPGTCNGATTNSQDYPYLKRNFFGTSVERAGTDQTICPINHLPSNSGTVANAFSYNCLTAKRMVFHYGMFVNYINSHHTYSGWGEVEGNDFVVSLGNFVNGVGNIDEQEGSIMHELGHNLGLNHGGQNDAVNNCKPNYLSVMNYLYQFRENSDSCRPLAYSNALLNQLAEGSLSDSNIGTYPYPNDNPLQGPDGQTAPGGGNCPQSGERKIFWTPTTVPPATTGVTNDWNNNGFGTAPQPYQQVLNNFGGASCTFTSPVNLNGYNDVDWIVNDPQGQHPLNFRLSQSNFWQGNLQGNDDPEIGEGVNHADPPFNTPIDLQANAQPDHIGLTWQAPPSNNALPVTAYKIYRSGSSGTETFLVQVPPGATNYDDMNVVKNITYFYKVSAVSQTGESPQSDEAFATCPDTCKSAPDTGKDALYLTQLHDLLTIGVILQIATLVIVGILMPLVLRRP